MFCAVFFSFHSSRLAKGTPRWLFKREQQENERLCLSFDRFIVSSRLRTAVTVDGGGRRRQATAARYGRDRTEKAKHSVELFKV